MINIIRNQEKSNQQLRDINTERPVAALSLRVNADFALAVAGATVTWSNEIRNLLFTWSGSNITIPNDGMYHICASMRTNVVIASLDGGIDVVRGGSTYLGVLQYRLTPSTFSRHVYSFTQYFLKDDIIRFRLIPSVATTILYRPEITGANGQSGIFHITQLTESI